MPKKLIKTTDECSEGRCSAGQGWVGHPVVDRVTGADQYARLDAEAATAISETQLGWGWRAASSSATARGPIFQHWSNWSSTPALITSVSEQWSTSIKTSTRQNSHLNKLSCCTKPSFFLFWFPVWKYHIKKFPLWNQDLTSVHQTRTGSTEATIFSTFESQPFEAFPADSNRQGGGEGGRARSVFERTHGRKQF